MPQNTEKAVAAANRLYRKFGTRNPDELAPELHIFVMPCPFKKQKGAYKVIQRNSFIFIKEDLPSCMHRMVMLHEIGHHILHRQQAIASGGFQEFVLFDMQDNRMEYEANLFAAQLSLPDAETVDLIYQGMDVAQIAAALHSDINLVALKVAALNRQGYRFREQEHNNRFLK